MVKVLLIFISSFLGLLTIKSQSVDWQWAQNSHGPGYQEGNSVVTDADGNVCITGYFHGDSVTFDSVTLLNGAYGNCYLAKYTSSGNLLWAKGAFVPSQDNPPADIEGNILATDGKNFYEVGGYIGASITLDGIALPYVNTGSDFYLVKYDSAGNVVWVQNDGGYGNDWGEAIATDGAGHVYAAGNYTGLKMHIGQQFLFNSGLDNPSDFFVAKYDDAGNLMWAKTAGGANNNARVESIASDSIGNVYLTGTFSHDSIWFGNFKLVTADTGASNIYVAKYDSGGNVLWAVSAGGAGDDGGDGITVDKNGNVYVTGSFNSDSITFGPITLHSASPGLSYDNYFLAKLDSSGNVLWAKSAGGNNDDAGLCVATDRDGQVYVSGSFMSDSISFDSLTLQYPAGAPNPMFIVTYGSNGAVICAGALASGSGGADQNGICADNAGSAYAVSTYYGVNPFTLGNLSLPATGTGNVFLAKLNCGLNTNLETINENPLFEIYPNPFSSQTTVRYSLAEDAKNGTLEIHDIFGRNMRTIELINHLAEISVTTKNLDSGIYFFSLVADGKPLASRRVIVME